MIAKIIKIKHQRNLPGQKAKRQRHRKNERKGKRKEFKYKRQTTVSQKVNK